MQCDHPVIKSVDGILFCCECGAILPLSHLVPAEEKPKQEEPKKPIRRKKKEVSKE